MVQIPPGRFARCEGDGRGIVYLAADKNEARTLENAKYIACSNFNVGRRVFPAVDVGADVDDKASAGGLTAQARENFGLLLRNQLHRAGLVSAAEIRT